MLQYNDDALSWQVSTVAFRLPVFANASADHRTLLQCILLGITPHRARRPKCDHINDVTSRSPGEFPVMISSSDFRFSFDRDGLRLRMYVEYSAASLQKLVRKPESKIMHRTMLKIVRCIGSAFPFEA